MNNKAVLAAGKPERAFEVQYNPAALSLGQNASLSFELFFDGQGGEDVQSAVQGFLGMLSSPEAKYVVFYWGDMSYPGEITQMRASYDYFSAEGAPLRAKVNMTIRQTGNCGSQLDYWERAYERFLPE